MTMKIEKYFTRQFDEDRPTMGYLYKCKLCQKEWEADYSNWFEYDYSKEHLINDHGFTLQEIEGTVTIYESGLTEKQ